MIVSHGLLGFLLPAVILSMAVGGMAVSRGRRFVAWFLRSAVLSIAALIAMLMLVSPIALAFNQSIYWMLTIGVPMFCVLWLIASPIRKEETR